MNPGVSGFLCNSCVNPGVSVQGRICFLQGEVAKNLRNFRVLAVQNINILLGFWVRTFSNLNAQKKPQTKQQKKPQKSPNLSLNYLNF